MAGSAVQVLMLLLHNQRAPRMHDALAQLRVHLKLFDFTPLTQAHPAFKAGPYLCCHHTLPAAARANHVASVPSACAAVQVAGLC